MSKFTTQLVAELNKDMTDAVVVKHVGEGGTYYEVGIELPMDFAGTPNLDAVKICNLVGINALPIAVDNRTSNKYGILENKPAVFMMATENNEMDVIKWANECMNKVADYDFATYVLTNGDYDALTRDDQPDWVKDQSYNVDSGEWEEVL